MTHFDTYTQLIARVRALKSVGEACHGMPAALRVHYANLLSEVLGMALAGWGTDIVANRASGVAKVFRARGGPGPAATGDIQWNREG